jgi:hypothetical protein
MGAIMKWDSSRESQAITQQAERKELPSGEHSDGF